MARLRDLLTGKELEHYKEATSFARPDFQSEAEKINYYARMSTSNSPYCNEAIAVARSADRPRIRVESDLARLNDELNDPKAIMSRIAQTLGDVETLRGSVAIAYFTAYRNVPRSDIYINNHDKNALLDVLNELPVKNDKLDFIVHSPGGLLDIGEEIIELLRSRFSHISFIVPDKAKSTATLMAIAANEIILCEGASLSPFDPLIAIPPNGEYEQAYRAASVAKRAFWGKLLLPFHRQSAYPGWTLQNALNVVDRARDDEGYYKILATIWLIKYMFGHDEVSVDNTETILKWLRLKYARKTRAVYRKASKIASFFMNYDLHIRHERPLTRSRISNLGLNLSQAEGELNGYAREVYLLSKALFQTLNAANPEFPYFTRLWTSKFYGVRFYEGGAPNAKTANQNNTSATDVAK
jgi:hypothetical protein